jgi:hypothetical protein
MEIKILIILKKVKPINQNSLDKLYYLGNNTFIEMEKICKVQYKITSYDQNKTQTIHTHEAQHQFDLQNLCFYSTNDQQYNLHKHFPPTPIS